VVVPLCCIALSRANLLLLILKAIFYATLSTLDISTYCKAQLRMVLLLLQYTKIAYWLIVLKDLISLLEGDAASKLAANSYDIFAIESLE